MKMKNKVWRSITIIVVIFLMLNPEMAELSLFINVIGIDMFIILLQVQLLGIVGIILKTKIKPLYGYLKNQLVNLLGYIFVNIKNEPKIILLFIPRQAAIMNALVFSAILGIAINA